MDLNRLTHDADNLIRKVVSRYNQIYIPTGNISQVELDLMLDDLRKLYDTFKTIGQVSLTLQNSIVKPEVTVNIPVPADSRPLSPAGPVSSEKQTHTAEPGTILPKADPEPSVVINQESTTQQEMVSDIKTTDTPVTRQESGAEPVSEPEPGIKLVKENEAEIVQDPESNKETLTAKQVSTPTDTTDAEKPVQEIANSAQPVNPGPSPAMLADRFNTGNKSLSESLASSQIQGVMGTRILFQPIADLITGIGLNDKFSFISDLFDNSAAQYDEAIARIDKAVNLDEANWILHKYHTAEWEKKQETLARLKEFIKRRFI